MSVVFPTSTIELLRSAAPYITEAGRLAHLTGEQPDSGGADAFAAVQSEGMKCTGRLATTEITKELLRVPADVKAFNNRLKGQLDAIVDEFKGLYVVDIQITPQVSHFLFKDRGRKSVEAVWLYLFDKGVNPNLMSTRGKNDDSRTVENDGVKIKIIGMPRDQMAPRTMPDKSALSCIVRFTDGTSITTGPR
jgi:muconolactone delta-isomerase